MMKDVIKKILGYALLSHLLPGIFILINVAKGGLPEYGYLIPYLAGIAITISIALAVLFWLLIFWLLDI